MATVQQGCIVRAKVVDPTGGNPKIRPLIVVSANSDIAAQEKLFAIAVTSSFRAPLEPDEILLPWHPNGRVRTGLVKPCVAKCSWLCEMEKSEIVEVRGRVPSDIMEELLRRIATL